MKLEQKTAKQVLDLIIENKMKFKLAASFLKTVKSMYNQKEEYTPNQLSYIDGLYEKYMKAGGFESVQVKHDMKKKY
jgi:hypothetical protein